MKILFIALIASISFVGCTKEDTVVVTDPDAGRQKLGVVFETEFQDGRIEISQIQY